MSGFRKKARRAVGRAALIGIVAVIIIIVAVAGYLAISSSKASSTAATTTSSTSSIASTSISTISSSSNTAASSSSSSSSIVSLATSSSSSSITSTGAGPQNSSQLTVLAIGGPTSMEPAGAFSSEETLVVANVYQQLLTFNGSDATTLLPMLATSWNMSQNALTFNFTLRNDAYFRNGEDFNASSVWFNYYRVLVMNQIGASFFSSILYNSTASFAYGYVVPYGLDDALAANGYSLSTTNTTLRWEEAASDLASILSNFNPSNSTIQSIMSYPNQAVVVTGQYSVQFNLVNPYLNFPYAVASTGGGQIDPLFVDQNGGVQANNPNTYVNSHDMSTGPYYIKSFVPSESVTLEANPNYWAAKLNSSEQNVMLTPPHIPVVIIEYSQTSSQVVEGLQSNLGGLMAGPPIPALTPNSLPSLANTPGLQVVSLSNAPTYAYKVTAMDTQKYPTNITDFRLALVHAVNYSEILSSVGMGYAQEMVGPISPGLPYYNPGNLSQYSYDPNLSIQLLVQAGFKVSLTNGTTLNSGGTTIPAINMIYWNADPSETKIAQEFQVMFASIGVTLTLDGETSAAGLAAVSNPANSSGYPNLYIWSWYPSYFDPVYQDLVVVTNSAFSGVFGNTASFSNATVDNLTNSLPFLTNKTQVLDEVKQVYNMVYQQAPYIWVYAVDPYWVQRTYLQGVFYNPALEGFFFPTMYYS